MTMKAAIVASLVGSAAAFTPASNGRAATSLAVEKSKALPFLPAPANCEGYVGNVGFDPLGVSNYVPVDYLREAELKHGRMCQLAWLGYIAVDLGARVPGYPEAMSSATSATAHGPAVEYGALGNVLVWIAFAEMTSWIGVSQMLQGSGRAPGDFGFGKKFLDGKTDAQIESMKLKEITHCRAAMLAFSGVVTQSVLYDKGFPYF
jgi:light-harvesting complex I chlorophyll a/b binding protein 1